jgi:hypothetical protein
MSLLPMIPAKHNTFWKGALTTIALAAAYNYLDDKLISHIDPCPVNVQADYFKSLMTAGVKVDSVDDVRIVLTLPNTGKCAVEMRVPGDLAAAGIYSAPVNTATSPAPTAP